MQTILLEERNLLSDQKASELGGTLLGKDSYDIVICGDTKVLKPDGSPLLIYRSKVLTPSACSAAYKVLRKAATLTDNRGYASGTLPPVDQDPSKDDREHTETILKNAKREGPFRIQKIKRDGTLSKQTRAVPIYSGIVGHYDRSVRFPYCRMTAFNINHPDQFVKALPFIREIDAVFKQELPERYNAQIEVVKASSSDFIISNTAFTTITVNKNWQTAVHKDVGDLKEGFGVMTALRGGTYKGGLLVFPKYRVAVDMRTQGVLLADVHSWHGNTQIIGIKGEFERISCVLYYREGIKDCGSAAEELDRAKNRKRGDPLRDDRK